MTDNLNYLAQTIYDTAHEFPGGAKALAEKIGTRAGTFNNKCDPAMDRHVININEAQAMMKVSDDHRILHTMARDLGYVCVDIPEYSGVSDMEILNAWAEWDTQRGETADAIKRSLEDHRIRTSELQQIRKEMYEDFQKELALLARLESLVDD